MDCFYIITNKLKDPDFAITNVRILQLQMRLNVI